MINTVSSKLGAWWRIHVVFSKTLFFICVLISSISFVEFAVATVVVDYFTEVLNYDIVEAAVITNLTDALLSLLVILPRFSETYVGRFNVITFYSGAYATGLMLLWVNEACAYTQSQFYMFFSLAFLLLVLGKSGSESSLHKFLEYQMNEKVKGMNPESQNMDTEEEQEKNEVRVDLTWMGTFKISALVMGGGYQIFYSGCFYYTLEKPTKCEEEENEFQFLRKIYVVYKAAFRKRKQDYPVSPDSYYWKDQRQSNVYSKREGQTQFLPKAFGVLDKAAIIIEANNLKDVYSVKEVREVKRFSSVIVLLCSILPYGLMTTIASTFFVQQAETMRYNYNTSALFVMSCWMRCVVTWFFWWKNLEKQSITKVRIFCGMLCSVFCCFVAFWVEHHRLSSDDVVDGSWLIPQFLLLGLAEALVEDGVEVFVCNHVPPSMCRFGELFTELLFAVGKLLTVVFALIFRGLGWFKESLGDSKLERYYVWLAILNFVFLFIYGYYSRNHALSEAYPEDQELTMMEE
ncbi:protein NRT1/ PTR FAMILY 5.4-like [Senna tora]|uniref:Protein NRT1/ PTR FAMILY 5.4-like n=1 Tax=Senna tora TaxID=362788 RepID=A0A834XKD0_9FABA|nr:protein NRT1/ PTR FAMILY 5.4-like [Senna tora]